MFYDKISAVYALSSLNTYVHFNDMDNILALFNPCQVHTYCLK